MKKEVVAMLLAGGQGSRLYALTSHVAKPAVPFGGKYRIIDFPLSNCVNSGIDTVGAPPSDEPDWGIAVVAGGVNVGPKAVIKPSAMIREDVKGGEQA